MDLGRRLHWVRGVTSKELAADWGVSVSAAESYASEAWRRMQAEVETDAHLPVKLATITETIIDEAFRESRNPVAMERGTDHEGNPRIVQESPSVPRKTALEGVKVMAALRTPKTSLGLIHSPEWTRMSIVAKRELLARAHAKLIAVEAEIDAQTAAESLAANEPKALEAKR